MSMFKVNVVVVNPKREELATAPVEALVDTGSEPSEVLMSRPSPEEIAPRAEEAKAKAQVVLTEQTLCWQMDRGASQILAMGAQAVSHGVAEEGSPRREPWGKISHHQKPRQGRQNCGQREFSFAASRLRLSIPQPTADAMGYLLPLLRSYLPPLSKTRDKVKPQKLTEVPRKIRSISAKL